MRKAENGDKKPTNAYEGSQAALVGLGGLSDYRLLPPGTAEKTAVPGQKG